ncbi:uncharacterized protein LOC100897309 [Galendromus occidentalis]|uniref:Uncharacterized protein LOC100897309 n=1 Tax=Galendromus occidentalis TaxID=34638 RepID=A0AAJ6QUT5_9ACAR|nr:uncharacterized protein LOC100897309 [Galendromus occidentalis]
MEYSWVTTRNETRATNEKSPSLPGSISNISQASQEAPHTGKRLKAPLDVVQLIKANYGISLTKQCETRLREAVFMTNEDFEAEMQQLRNRDNLKRGEGDVQLDADVVEQLYHLTKFRHELTLDVKPTPQWTEEQFVEASEIFRRVSEKSSRANHTLNTVTELAEDLALVDPSRVNV